MNAFWKWLMRTNARAVFLAAVLALLAVTAFWMWMLSTPLEDVTVLPSSSRNRPDSGFGLSVLSYVESLSRPASAVPERNPFMRDSGRSHAGSVPTVTTVRTTTETPAPGRTVISAAPGNTGAAAGTASPAPRKSVSLTYRGLYKRSDGRVMVLLEDSDSKGSSFYDVDATVFGMKIGEVAAENVKLVPGSGEAVTLQRGESVVFNGI